MKDLLDRLSSETINKIEGSSILSQYVKPVVFTAFLAIAATMAPVQDAKAVDLGQVIGAIGGAALGNQIGGGSGKDIATAAGAVIGADFGKQNNNMRNVQYNNYENYDNNGNGSNIVKKGVGAIVGAGLGNQIGGGSGKKIATVAGAIIGAEMMDDGNQQNNQYQRYDNSGNGRSYNSGYERMHNNRGYHNNGSINVNRFQPGEGIPITNSDMLYQIGGTSVKMGNSMGIASLTGRLRGNMSLDANPVVKENVVGSCSDMVFARQALDEASMNFIHSARNGNPANYARNQWEFEASQNANRMRMRELQEDYNKVSAVQKNYADARFFCSRNLDLAASEGFDLASDPEIQGMNVLANLSIPKSTALAAKMVGKPPSIQYRQVNPNEVGQLDMSNNNFGHSGRMMRRY